ncbi:RNA-binding protein 42 [Choanephora cucurbitarum]|uniref:RNA-binding protein 42 n=1 Tax=Choanephora cucurbitarum TaxID=101091 RepID=A0A1C7NQJ2_9FUNG|nr:RNA-binding protein 42 [Choanephora cucurbitarum]
MSDEKERQETTNEIEKQEQEQEHYAAEEYAVNDYAPPVEYTVPKGYYDDNGNFVEYSEYDYTADQNYTDPNQYYYGQDYTSYADPNYNYDYYYDQSAYDTSDAKVTDVLPSTTPSVTATPTATPPVSTPTTNTYYGNSTTGANATTTYGYNNSNTNHLPINAPVGAKVYYPSTANANNPVGPVIITKSGYAGPTSSTLGSPAPTSSSADDGKKGKNKKKKNIVRAAGGEVWEDNTLSDWDENDFRLFAGDLGNEVTEELLYKTFSKYPSLVRTRVVRDSRTMKTKGYGFISFKDPDDFVRAWREMNGKYVGNRPIKLRKSNWKERNIDVKQKKEKERFGPYTKPLK